MPRQAKTKRRTRKEPTAEQLFAEMMGLVKSAGSRPGKARPAGKASQRTRLARLQKALASGSSIDALAKVRELIADDGVGAQQIFVYGFACMLETSSAGLSIVFDRFDAAELRKIGSSLEHIGATRTLTAFRRLQKSFERAAHKVDEQSRAYADEMEQKLLALAKAHVQDLAAG